ncbi:MAG: sulfite exporter TauE/SafE family protein [Sulfitobacter sp.]
MSGPTFADPSALALAALALLLGGVLKGATGAGSPVVAVPILSLLYGVPFAVTIFVLPNLLTNLWQSWKYGRHMVRPRFAAAFAISGGVGAGVGSVMLAALPAQALMLGVGAVVLLYIGFRLAKPSWQLSRFWGDRLVLPMGLLGGVMQGAGGISAPISVTFLNALRLERAVFIATISAFFAMMSLVQIPALWSLGLLGPERLGQSLIAVMLLFAGMPMGEALAKRLSAQTFDRMMLALLTVISLRLIWTAVT